MEVLAIFSLECAMGDHHHYRTAFSLIVVDRSVKLAVTMKEVPRLCPRHNKSARTMGGGLDDMSSAFMITMQ